MYFLKTSQVRSPCHGGVLYSFFYIYGMLFEFFMWVWFFFLGGGNVFLQFNPLSNISRKKYPGNKKKYLKKNSISFDVFLFFMLDLFLTFFDFFFGNIEKCPFTYWLNGRWSLQIVHIGNFNMKLNGRWFPQIVDSGNLYPIYKNCVSF